MLEKVCFDFAHLRTLHLCRAFCVTSKQHYSRTVKRRTISPQNVTAINAANVPTQPRQSSNKLDDFHGIIEPQIDDSQFK